MYEVGLAITLGVMVIERVVSLLVVPMVHRRNGSGPASVSSIDSKINDVKLAISSLEGKVDTHCQVMDLKFDQLEHRVTMVERSGGDSG